MQHALRKTLEHYVPEEGRKVNLWSLMPRPEEFLEDVQRASLKVVKAFLELGLEQKRDSLVGADRHAREPGRADYRNGFYLRKSFRTAIGRIEGLRIPRCRKRSLVKALEEQLERTKGALEEKVVEMFLKGLSVRAIGPLLDGLLGLPVSPAQVSRLARQWDHRVAQFHEGPLEDPQLQAAVNLLRGTNLLNDSLVHHHYLVRNGQGFLLIMGGNFVDAADQLCVTGR